MTQSAISGSMEYPCYLQKKRCALEPIQRAPFEPEARFLPTAAQFEALESRPLPEQLSLGKLAPAPRACYPLSSPSLG
jgi:hypothetical protein